MASPTTESAMKAASNLLLPRDYPSIVAHPTTTIPFFPKPAGFSLFHALFSRFSDTFVLLLVALLSYTGIIAAVLLTNTTLGPIGKILLLGFSSAVAYPSLFVYFNNIHRWRKSKFAQRYFFTPPGTLSLSLGSTIKVGCVCLGILWGPVYRMDYALITLLAILVLVSLYLALRPAYDYFLVDGSIAGVAMYGLASDGPMYIPWVFVAAGLIIAGFRCYFEEKALQAENRGSMIHQW